jgi:resolvase-like protein
VAIYLRVSTSKQDTDNQRRELEAVAARSGWHVVKIYEEAGISGAKGRDKRPGLDAMLRAVNVKEFDMAAAWSVDRLGRSLTDLLGILQSLHDKGVDLFLHQHGLDTSTSAGKAMLVSKTRRHKLPDDGATDGSLARPTPRTAKKQKGIADCPAIPFTSKVSHLSRNCHSLL